MERTERSRLLDKISQLLIKYHVVSIDRIFEGDFTERVPVPVEVGFTVSSKHDCVEGIVGYINGEIIKENLNCNLVIARKKYDPKITNYLLKVERYDTISTEEYSNQTNSILHKIPHLIKDYKQKHPKHF